MLSSLRAAIFFIAPTPASFMISRFVSFVS
jgi:hypothetical protein